MTQITEKELSALTIVIMAIIREDCKIILENHGDVAAYLKDIRAGCYDLLQQNKRV